MTRLYLTGKLVCIFLYSAIFINIQENSLKANTISSAADTARINAMNEKAMFLHRSKSDSALYLARYCLKQSKTTEYTLGIADAYKVLGYTHFFINFTSNDSSRYYFELALDLYQKLENNEGIGSANYGLGYFYSLKGDLNKSEYYFLEGLSSYSRIQNMRGMFNSYHALSHIYKQHKDYKKSEEYINKAIVFAMQTEDLSAQANLHNTKGNVYKDQALFEQAIDIYFNALNLWEAANDSAGMAIAYGSIGNMYYFQHNYNKSLEYNFKKLPISIKENNIWEVSKTYNSIAMVYNSLGNYDSALYYHKKSLQMNLKMNYASGIADSYHALANTYFFMSTIDSAFYYADKSIVIARNIYDRAKLASYYISRGKIYLKDGKGKMAQTDFQKGYDIAKELKLPFEISEASRLLSRIHFSNNNYQDAYTMLREHKLMQDSLNKAENIRKITQLELQYEFDKKQRIYERLAEQERQAQEARLFRQKMMIIGLSIVLLFLVLFGVLIIRQKNLQVKFKTMELGQKLLRIQMNPHFIFNSLAAIQDYMYNNNAKEAGNFLSRFAALMRQILENSRTEYISVENEIGMLNNYLEIQKLRFGNKFTYEIEVDTAIDQETCAIPPMLTQPFIENAIEHGLMPKKKAGRIHIRLHLNNGLLNFEVEDNGVGRSNTINLDHKPDKRSMATILTKERLAYMKKQTGKESHFIIEDLYSGEMPAGTKVTLSIPYQIIYD